MELVLDRPMTKSSVDTNEAQEHNALIKERYRKLQSAEADQFATPSYTAPAVEPQASTVYAPMFASTATVEQTPQVTEYVRHMESAIFTAEKFERMENAAMQEIAPTFVADVTTNAPTMATVSEVSEGYALNSLAKFMIGVFAAVVV